MSTHSTLPLHKLLSNPSSLFEHRIFTTLTVLMRNLTEQFQDYRDYYTDTFNVSSVVIDGGGGGEVEEVEEEVEVFWRVLISFVLVLGITHVVNKKLFRNRVIKYGVELVICEMIILPLLPFIGLFFGVIGLGRLALWLHIKVWYNGRVWVLSPEDGFWAYEEYASSSCSIGLYIVEGRCDIDKIRRKVKSVVGSSVVGGRMMRRLKDMWGFAVWERVDEWDVRDYVRVVRKGGAGWGDKEVLDFLSTFQDEPLSRERAAWDVIVVPDVRVEGGGNGYACVFRVHHAMMDGISSANILHQVLGDKPFKFTIDPVEGKRVTGIKKFLSYALAFVLLPRTGFVNGLMNLDNKYNKWCMPGKVLQGPKHFCWSRPFRMEAIKEIKQRSGSSVMNVLLSGLGGAYRRMDDGRGGGKENVVEFYHALAPVAMLPYEDRHPRNGFSGVVLPVAVGHCDSAMERLRKNEKEFKSLGLGLMDILGNFMLIGMVGIMPTRLQKVFGVGVHVRMSLSNIPGSEEEIRIFGGDRICEMGAWLPCKFSLGMAMGMFSYAGRCRVTMVGDQSYLSKSDVESLVRNFETEISNLGKSLGMAEKDIFL